MVGVCPQDWQHMYPNQKTQNSKLAYNQNNKNSPIAEAGNYTPVVDENKFTLAEVGKAHDLLESGKAVGKVVVEN